MRTEPRFVRPSDFDNYTGKNLRALLRVPNGGQNACNLFLMQIEDMLLTRVDVMTFRNNAWEDLTEFQLECLQKAIIYEAEYILRNGDLFTDSGYDEEKGIVITQEQLNKIAICSVSKDYLIRCGLWNHVITNRRRYTRFE